MVETYSIVAISMGFGYDGISISTIHTACSPYCWCPRWFTMYVFPFLLRSHCLMLIMCQLLIFWCGVDTNGFLRLITPSQETVRSLEDRLPDVITERNAYIMVPNEWPMHNLVIPHYNDTRTSSSRAAIAWLVTLSSLYFLSMRHS
jgi:hypothetical protein